MEANQDKQPLPPQCECHLTEEQKKIANAVWDEQRFQVGPLEAMHKAVEAVLKHEGR